MKTRKHDTATQYGRFAKPRLLGKIHRNHLASILNGVTNNNNNDCGYGF